MDGRSDGRSDGTGHYAVHPLRTWHSSMYVRNIFIKSVDAEWQDFNADDAAFISRFM